MNEFEPNETPGDETVMNHYVDDDVDPTFDHSGRHPVNIGDLVMGIAFLGLATIWLLFETEVVRGNDLNWLLPLPWLAAGLAGLIGISLTGRRSRPGQQ